MKKQTKTLSSSSTRRLVFTRFLHEKNPSKKPPTKVKKAKAQETTQVSSAVESENVILGLDVNSQSTGYTVIDSRGNMLDLGVIPHHSKQLNIYERALVIKEKLKELNAKFGHPQNEEKRKKWIVGVEEFLKGFGSYNWQSNSMFTLAQINSLVTYDCMHVFHTHPYKVLPNSARAMFGLKKDESKDIKTVVFDYVAKLLPSYEWKKTPKGNIHKSEFDKTDSYLIALYTLKKHMDGTPTPKTIVAKKKKQKKKVSKTKERKSKKITQKKDGKECFTN